MPPSGFKGVSWNSRMKAWLTFYYDDKIRRSRTFHPRNYNHDTQESLLAAIEFAKKVNTGPRTSVCSSKSISGKAIQKKILKGSNSHIKNPLDQVKKKSDSDFDGIECKKNFQDWKNAHILDDLNAELREEEWIKSSLPPNFPVSYSIDDKYEYVRLEDLNKINWDDSGLFFTCSHPSIDLSSTKIEKYELEEQVNNAIFHENKYFKNKRDMFTFDLEKICQVIELLPRTENSNIWFDRTTQVSFSLPLRTSLDLNSYSSMTTALFSRTGTASSENLGLGFPPQFLAINSFENHEFLPLQFNR